MKNKASLLAAGVLAAIMCGGVYGADFREDYSRRLAAGDVTPGVAAYLTDSVDDARVRDAMTFLYAYMSLPDMTGYSPAFFRENVEAAIKARETMPWGDNVEEREWLHFVLPVRVNNEPLDSSRILFFDSLRERLAGMTMEEAALEVNHWCHERVTYRPSDARTSSPLSTVSQAIGRCGEESTFTVAALRSVGIPARQVYTPRWSHTDSNHAWVEAQIDGKWRFFGACEPEPVLDMAWFNAPAARGILMHTDVFGRYDGPEEVIEYLPTTTTINITSNYAPVDTVRVLAADAAGNPLPGATVDFCIYNYGEFYPAARKKADESGRASLTTGLGDIMVMVNDGAGGFGMKTVRSGSGETVVAADKNARYCGSEQFDIVPPVAGGGAPQVSAEAREANRRRLAAEDSLRGAYESTFATQAYADSLAKLLGLSPAESASFASAMVESRGNHKVIEDFLRRYPEVRRHRGADLLRILCEKDRRDIPAEVLDDVLLNTPPIGETDFGEPEYVEYVMDPRVEYERLVPYRDYFIKRMGADSLRHFRKTPEALVSYVSGAISIDSVWNPHGYRSDPVATSVAGRTTPLSRSIYFVSLARTCGIAARIDRLTGKTQYLDPKGGWIDVKFEAEEGGQRTAPKGSLRLSYTPTESVKDPVYYDNFSILRLEDGRPRQLEYDDGASFSRLFTDPVELDAGQYMLVSGQRMADGSVLAATTCFLIREGETTEAELVMRNDESRPSVIGSLDAENIYHDLASDTDRSILSATGRGYYVLGVVRPGHEPTAHFLNEMSAMKSEFERAGVPVMLLYTTAEEAAKSNASLSGALPENIIYGVDKEGVILDALTASIHLPAGDLPVVVIADSFNRVVFASHGYTIGTAGRLLQTLRLLE